MARLRITTGIKYWRFKALPATYHLRAVALAARATYTTNVFHGVEETMIHAVSLGLDQLERTAGAPHEGTPAPVPLGASPALVGPPPARRAALPEPYEPNETIDWRPHGEPPE